MPESIFQKTMPNGCMLDSLATIISWTLTKTSAHVTHKNSTSKPVHPSHDWIRQRHSSVDFFNVQILWRTRTSTKSPYLDVSARERSFYFLPGTDSIIGMTCTDNDFLPEIDQSLMRQRVDIPIQSPNRLAYRLAWCVEGEVFLEIKKHTVSCMLFFIAKKLKTLTDSGDWERTDIQIPSPNRLCTRMPSCVVCWRRGRSPDKMRFLSRRRPLHPTSPASICAGSLPIVTRLAGFKYVFKATDEIVAMDPLQPTTALLGLSRDKWCKQVSCVHFLSRRRPFRSNKPFSICAGRLHIVTRSAGFGCVLGHGWNRCDATCFSRRLRFALWSAQHQCACEDIAGRTTFAARLWLMHREKFLLL